MQGMNMVFVCTPLIHEARSVLTVLIMFSRDEGEQVFSPFVLYDL